MILHGLTDFYGNIAVLTDECRDWKKNFSGYFGTEANLLFIPGFSQINRRQQVYTMRPFENK